MNDRRSDMTPWKGGRCLVYARCSTESQDASIPDQMETIDRERKRLSVEPVVPAFVDDGLKGHDETRPALRAILAYVRSHPNPVRTNADFIPILVYDVSRFGRFDDPKKVFAYFVEVERSGYEFYSVTERIRSRGNIADFVQLIIKGEQAYDYSVNLSKYAMRTGCQLARTGWWPGGSPPYGYDRMTFGPDGLPKYRYATLPDKSVQKCLPDGKPVELLKSIEDRGKSRSPYSDKLKGDKVKLVPGDPDKVACVLSIFRRYAEEGKGLKWIARDLNDQGVTPPRGRIWLPVTVRFILRNPAYAGRLVYGRRSDGKHHWLEIEKTETGYESRIERKDVPGRTFVHRSEEECIVVENCHEAIVPPKLFDATRERIEEQKRTSGHADAKSGRAVRSAYLLSGDGLIKCSSCGYSFSGRTDPRTKVRYYYDAGYDRGGSSVCRCSYVPADEVESWILERIQSRLFPNGCPSVDDIQSLAKEIELDLALEGVEEKSVDPVRDIQRRLDEKRRKVKLILGALEEDSLVLAKDELRVLNREIRSLEDDLELASAKGGSPSRSDLKTQAREMASRIADFRRIIDRGTSEERKEFVRLFVGEILVDAAKGEVSVGFFELPEGRFGISYVWDQCPQRESNPCPGLERAVS